VPSEATRVVPYGGAARGRGLGAGSQCPPPALGRAVTGGGPVAWGPGAGNGANGIGELPLLFEVGRAGVGLDAELCCGGRCAVMGAADLSVWEEAAFGWIGLRRNVCCRPNAELGRTAALGRARVRVAPR
jgi:hypothetical protein